LRLTDTKTGALLLRREEVDEKALAEEQRADAEKERADAAEERNRALEEELARLRRTLGGT
jgi:hypothetical protein